MSEVTDFSGKLRNEALYELRRSIQSLWSDLIIKYYMGAQLDHDILFEAQGSSSCRSMKKLNGMGCELLNVSCRIGSQQGNTADCKGFYESACDCPGHIPTWASTWLRIPPIYTCQSRHVKPIELIRTLEQNGYDFVKDFATFQEDFKLSDLEVINPLIIRPENYYWPRFYVSVFDLLGLTRTNPAIIDVTIPVGQCVFNQYFVLFTVLATMIVGFTLYYPIRFWKISRRRRKKHVD